MGDTRTQRLTGSPGRCALGDGEVLHGVTSLLTDILSCFFLCPTQDRPPRYPEGQSESVLGHMTISHRGVVVRRGFSCPRCVAILLMALRQILSSQLTAPVNVAVSMCQMEVSSLEKLVPKYLQLFTSWSRWCTCLLCPRH